MIGILNAYHFDATSVYQQDYSRIFNEFVQNIFPDKKNEIIEYKVAQEKFPQSVFDCDIWFITGSPKSVYEDIPWIKQLKAFTQELNTNKRKIIGICFGHQMVAHALGGKVSKNIQGWGVGVRSFEVIHQKAWMSNYPTDQKKISLLFSHQDQVEISPPNAELLARDNFCSNQMLQIGEHILTLQGHPEFTVEFAKERLISRKAIINPDTFDQAMKSYEEKINDEMVISWIREFTQMELN